MHAPSVRYLTSFFVSFAGIVLWSGSAVAAPVFSYTTTLVSPSSGIVSGLPTGDTVTLTPGSNPGRNAGFPGGTNITPLTINVGSNSGTSTNTISQFDFCRFD